MASSSDADDLPPDVYKEHFQEIHRRRDTKDDSKSTTECPSAFQKSSHSAPDTYVIPDQSFVLFSISHKEMSPKSTRGYVRIYGIFESADEAVEHGKELNGTTNVSFFCAPAREWIVAASSMIRLTDPKAMIEHRDRLLANYDLELERDKDQFDASVSAKEDANPPIEDITDHKEVKDDEDDEVVEAIPDGYKRTKLSLPATARVEGQRFAVVSFVDDDEFLFCVHGCFDDLDEADAWVRNVASQKVLKYHLDIVATCKWICPQDMKKAPKELFRNDELDGIMQYHSKEPERVMEYKEFMKKEGLDEAASNSVSLVQDDAGTSEQQ